jgi:hypothetical protein
MRSLVTGLLTLGVLTSVQVSWAEDPVVVVYDDPSLTRLEKQIGVTPAQLPGPEPMRIRAPASSPEEEEGVDAVTAGAVEVAEADPHSQEPRVITCVKS